MNLIGRISVSTRPALAAIFHFSCRDFPPYSAYRLLVRENRGIHIYSVLRPLLTKRGSFQIILSTSLFANGTECFVVSAHTRHCFLVLPPCFLTHERRLRLFPLQVHENLRAFAQSHPAAPDIPAVHMLMRRVYELMARPHGQ